MQAAPQALTVSELTRQVRHLLEVSFLQVWVEGEISGFSKPGSGHWYFTLKDSKAQIRCAMFRNRNQRVAQPPKEGDQILVRAKVSLYEARGDFQLIVEGIEPAGLGALQKAFEELKAKLDREGLFSEQHKKTIPLPPRRVGLVTSATGAAVHDILTVMKRRFPGIPVSLYPTPVQGKDATASIVRAIELANEDDRCDVLIVGRGGGSLEDLWCFNEEAVARAIFASRLPIISAVGHEVDITIADLVADHRAPTPSAAAEKISPDAQKWLDALTRLEERLLLATRRRITQSTQSVSELGQRLRHPRQQLQDRAQRLDELELRLHQRFRHNLAAARERLQQYEARLLSLRPQRQIDSALERVESLQHRLSTGIQAKLRRNQDHFTAITAQLELVSPLATLSRGYAIVQREDGGIVRKATEVAIGEQVSARVGEGVLLCRVENRKKAVDATTA